MQQKMTSVSVEAQFAQKLAANEPVIRNKAVKKIRKWFSARSEPFTEAEMMRLWKGLYYCFWMSDKPLVQEELAENISAFITCFKNKQSSLIFIQSFLQTLGREWFGIDRWRVDKFMMFTRRFLRSTFKFVSQSDWSKETLTEVMEIFRKSLILCPQSQANIGFKLHVTDVFLEELAKVAEEKLSPDSLDTVLEPFLTAIKTAEEDRYREHIVERIFRHLLRQSDPGIKWQDEEFEESDDCDDEDVDDAMQDDGEEEVVEKEEGVKVADDPRAGGVHSVIPQLSVNYLKLSERMLELGSEEGLKKTCRDSLYELSKMYKDVANDVFPLGPNLEDEDQDIEKLKVTKTAKKIIREEEAYQKENKIKKAKYKKSLKQENKENELIQTNGEIEAEDDKDIEEAVESSDGEEATGEKLSSKEKQKARKREQKKRRRETLLKEKQAKEAALKKENSEKDALDKVNKGLIDDDIERKKVEGVKTKENKNRGKGVLAVKEEKLGEKVEACDKIEKKKKKKDKAKKKENLIIEVDTSSKSPSVPEKSEEAIVKTKEKKKLKRTADEEVEKMIDSSPPKKQKKEADDDMMKKPTIAATEALDKAKERKTKKKLKKALYRIDSDIAFNSPSLSQINLTLEKKADTSDNLTKAVETTATKEASNVKKGQSTKIEKNMRKLKEEVGYSGDLTKAVKNETVASEVNKVKSPKSEKKKLKKMKKYNAEISLIMNPDETPIIKTMPSALDFSSEVKATPTSKKCKTSKTDDELEPGASPKNAKLFVENNSWPDDTKMNVGGDTIPGSPSAMVTPAKSFTATFLKKAMSKSEKKALKKEKLSTALLKDKSMSEPRKKKVNVMLTKNQAQNFSEHLRNVKNSPQTPHDPSKNPTKSALKKTPRAGGTEAPTTLNPVNLNTQLNARSKAAKLLNGKSQRKRAMDFF